MTSQYEVQLINMLLFGCITMEVDFYFILIYFGNWLHDDGIFKAQTNSQHECDLLGQCGRNSGVQVWT